MSNLKEIELANSPIQTQLNWKKILLFLGLLLVIFWGINKFNTQRVSLTKEQVKLELILEEIRKQTKYDLIGDMSLLENTNPVSINVKDKPLKEVLTQLSINQPIQIKVENETILILPK